MTEVIRMAKRAPAGVGPGAVTRVGATAELERAGVSLPDFCSKPVVILPVGVVDFPFMPELSATCEEEMMLVERNNIAVVSVPRNRLTGAASLTGPERLAVAGLPGGPPADVDPPSGSLR